MDTDHCFPSFLSTEMGEKLGDSYGWSDLLWKLLPLLSRLYWHSYPGFQAGLFSSVLLLKAGTLLLFSEPPCTTLARVIHFSVLTQAFQQPFSDDTCLSSSIFCWIYESSYILPQSNNTLFSLFLVLKILVSVFNFCNRVWFTVRQAPVFEKIHLVGMLHRHGLNGWRN